MSLQDSSPIKLHKPNPEKTVLQLPSIAISHDHSESPSSSVDPSSEPPTPGTPGTPGSATSIRSTYFTSRLQHDSHQGLSPASQDDKQKKRRSWFARNEKPKDVQECGPSPLAWVAVNGEKVPYDLGNIVNAQPLPEMWDDLTGDCLVYLFPQKSGKQAFFRVQSSILASSRLLSSLISDPVAESAAESKGSVTDSVPSVAGSTSSVTESTGSVTESTDSVAESKDSFDHEISQDKHLYIPITIDQSGAPNSRPSSGESVSEETEALIAVRNLFAFLTGNSLVATRFRPSFFDIFVKISQLLKSYEFANTDGYSYSDLVTSSFNAYVEDLGLADVRESLEKIIEGIVLGERMKNISLYNEAFTHAVGQYDAIMAIDSPKFRLVSPVTLNRLSRAAMDMSKWTATVWQPLHDLEFPSLFSGIMASRTADDRKHVDFGKWKDSFSATRKFFISFNKSRYKSWPPKPSSKNGVHLNRLVLQDIYRDLCSVYDLLIDHSTPNETLDEEPVVKALRNVFSEYNRSSPPVKPSMPFDVVKIPSLKATRPEFGTNEDKDAKAASKKLKDDEIAKVLAASHNSEASATEFVEAFKEMERKSAHSRNIKEIVDRRMGQWIFFHALLQLLPILVVDAPGIQYTKDVEYFLCLPPRSGVPWGREEATRSISSSSDGSGIVVPHAAPKLPADLVEPGIEGIYHRSHCWIKAQKWNPSAQTAPWLSEPTDVPPVSGLPTGLRPIGSRVPSSSSLRQSRPVSVYDPSKTFDSILASAGKAG